MSQPAQEESHRGVIQDGAVVFDRDPGLRDGTPVEVTVRRQPTGAPADVLTAMSQPPHPSDLDVDELLTQIDQGKRPVRFESPLS